MLYHPGHGPNRYKVIVSLCDYSGHWPMPYRDAGYTVAQFDLKHGDDCRHPDQVIDSLWDAIAADSTVAEAQKWSIHGILIATPCTAYTVSGARWWPRHDADGTRNLMDSVARGCLAVKDQLRPKWWALENPIGRIAKCVPEVGPKAFTFDPYQFAHRSEFVKPAAFVEGPGHFHDQYTKRTAIYGNCARPLTDAERGLPELPPIMVERIGKNGRVYRGSFMWANLGGKSERTKTLRSMTPMGFARAFFAANP